MENRFFLLKYATWAVSCCLLSSGALAEEKDIDASIEKISIIGSTDQLNLTAGSVTRITQDELELNEYDDIARILTKVPGVNVRLEDGYGLRPNIGFRGVTPERSKKINIMEDGILIGPAPYSAPAAYFFPLTSKMVGVEVTKGSAAIKHGPNTVAGALNMITRPIPYNNEGQFDLAVGSDGYQKAHAHYGFTATDDISVLLEGVTLRSDGFQELENGGDVGFEKNDLNAKVRMALPNVTWPASFSQSLVLKANYADETSNFTYTGLTDDDFRQSPYLRYAGGQDDRMDWEHTAFTLTHFLEGDTFSLTSSVYRTDLDRAWNKLNKFVSSFGNSVPSLLTIVSDPTNERNAQLLRVLRGDEDSTANSLLELGNNDRALYSQGIQTDGELLLMSGDISHTVEFGFRFHEDQIERNHTVENYMMTQGDLVATGEGERPTTTNTENTEAFSLYIQDSIEWRDFLVTAGVRYESIDGFFKNRAASKSEILNKSEDIFLPRLSVLYQVSDNVSVFAGVHRGFVPTSPAQDESIDFEKSVNYELGYRFSKDATAFEAVGFFNDYTNLIESCSFSAGCDTDVAFSGGSVDVYGIETSAGSRFKLGAFTVPIDMTYTFTDSEFKESFYSPFSLWNFVEAGNPLPYLARHQASLRIGLEVDQWVVSTNIAYTDDMPESAQTRATGSALDNPLVGKHTDAFIVVDVSAYYTLSDALRVYAKVDNLLDDESIVSRRPYGARPNRPRQFQLGFKYNF